MKCANCHKDGFYIYFLTPKKQVLFCPQHLPSFLETARKAGVLATTDAYKAALKDGLSSFTKPVEPAVEEPVEEVVEETTKETVEEETPAPKKKAVKKKAE